jgi:hypothetical protein
MASTPTAIPQGPNALYAMAAVSGPPTAPGKAKREVVREILSTLNHQPIEFYGRVIDQYGSPVAGAEIHGQVIYNTGVTSGVSKPEAVANSDGYFEFKGLSGRTLDFNITKPGYQFTAEGDAFDYTKLVPEEKRHHPNPKKPVVLKMWKLQGAEPLIYGSQTFDLPSDGSPLHIDLMTGKTAASGGDLIIILKHGRQPTGASITKYDWSVEVAVVNGGLVERDERVNNMYLAPMEGYLPLIGTEMSVMRSDWSRTYTRNFYLKTRVNIYSRVSFDLHTIPSGGSSYISLKWWLNPKPGSRTLEYDPTRQTSPR